MSVKFQWECDGCGEQKTTLESGGDMPPDWHKITVAISGFHGHPVPTECNGTHIYDLCPECQKRLDNAAHPETWARFSAEGKSA